MTAPRYRAEPGADRHDTVLWVRTYLAERRAALGLSQVEVAHRMGVTQSNVCDLEIGRNRDMRLGTLVRWADALEVDLEIIVRNR